MGKEHMLCYGPCHSVGLVECEDPWIEIGADFILENNMVFCVDIFLSDPDKERGIRFEDTILIKDNKIERLTDFHHSLIEIKK
jgi:Xaa-Pro aminopeptidase